LKSLKAKCLLIAAATSLLSCEGIQNQQFTTTVANGDMILLDTTGRSCKLQISGDPGTDADDLTAVKAIIGQFRIRWAGPNNLNLKYLRVRFVSSGISGGEQFMTFSGQDLAFIWNGVAALSPVAPSASDQSSTPLCTFEVGGINLVDKKKTIFGTGSLFIYGTTLEGDLEVPVTSEQFFNFRFDGVQ
jgi:hypothetical protein